MLQKAPALSRAFASLNRSLEPASRCLQKLSVTAASLGAYHAVTGATTALYSTTQAVPLTIDVGEQVTFLFSVSNTMAAASSWSVSGVVPPGLSVTGSNDEPLSFNNVFNANRGKVSGTATQAGSYSFSVQPWRDTNATGPTAEPFDIMITVLDANAPPILNSPIPDQSAEATKPFEYAFAAHFSDPDLGDTLGYTVTLQDGSTLPNWLSHSAGTLSGTPSSSDLGDLSIKIVADDGEATAEDSFQLEVVEPRVALAPDASIELNGSALVVTWPLQSDQSYTIETTETPLDGESWVQSDLQIAQDGNLGSVSLDTASLPERVFLRVASRID